MKAILTLLFCFVFGIAHSQCFELLSNKLDSTKNMPYGLYLKSEYTVSAGKTVSIKISDVKYKSKLAFLFQWSSDLGDTVDVVLMTLNWKRLAKKTMTKNDCILRYEPFKKSENYFLIVTIPERLDNNKKPVTSCLGLAVLERLTKRPFKQIQKIEWKAGATR